jgi:hypothetical protein
MMYNIQNYWVFGFCSLFGILKTREQRFGNWVYLCPQVRGGAPTLLGPLQRGPFCYALTHISEADRIQNIP